MKDPLSLFAEAERFVIERGFSRDIEWCENLPPFQFVSATAFLREYAWVVLNSGMRNAVIRAKWNDISKAFKDWHIRTIVADKDTVLSEALQVFRYRKKMKAILEVAEKLNAERWSRIQEDVEADPMPYFDSLPFIGPVTKYHLARNLGFDCVKPDRHLVRLAKGYGMTALELCEVIREKTGRRLGTIDVILWRFCEQGKQPTLSRWQERV